MAAPGARCAARPARCWAPSSWVPAPPDPSHPTGSAVAAVGGTRAPGRERGPGGQGRAGSTETGAWRSPCVPPRAPAPAPSRLAALQPRAFLPPRPAPRLPSRQGPRSRPPAPRRLALPGRAPQPAPAQPPAALSRAAPASFRERAAAFRARLRHGLLLLGSFRGPGSEWVTPPPPTTLTLGPGDRGCPPNPRGTERAEPLLLPRPGAWGAASASYLRARRPLLPDLKPGPNPRGCGCTPGRGHPRAPSRLSRTGGRALRQSCPSEDPEAGGDAWGPGCSQLSPRPPRPPALASPHPPRARAPPRPAVPADPARRHRAGSPRPRPRPRPPSGGSRRGARTEHVGVRSGGRGPARARGPVAAGSGQRRNRAPPPRAGPARGGGTARGGSTRPLPPLPAARARPGFKGAPGARAGRGVFPRARAPGSFPGRKARRLTVARRPGRGKPRSQEGEPRAALRPRAPPSGTRGAADVATDRVPGSAPVSKREAGPGSPGPREHLTVLPKAGRAVAGDGVREEGGRRPQSDRPHVFPRLPAGAGRLSAATWRPLPPGGGAPWPPSARGPPAGGPRLTAAARIRACDAGDPGTRSGARKGGLVWPSRADLLPPDAPRR
ncbi:basic proline-rich protein-like [Hyaena hyaena]|uniref:basic proline-rich protein-like n=1 Tax=Hyaena hyaena TaxID=95912 RepID=UPI001921A736|nr:basic proline-rich protein-like [Hyaena hyaena]